MPDAFADVIVLSGPDTVIVVPPPNCDGVIAPPIERASVVNVSGADAAAGDVARLPAASVELTRRKYVVFGVSPVKLTECATTDPGVLAVWARFAAVVP